MWMVLGPHKDREKLWPGWELNPRPSGLITVAPPTELEGQMRGAFGNWRSQVHGNELCTSTGGGGYIFVNIDRVFIPDIHSAHQFFQWCVWIVTDRLPCWPPCCWEECFLLSCSLYHPYPPIDLCSVLQKDTCFSYAGKHEFVDCATKGLTRK